MLLAEGIYKCLVGRLKWPKTLKQLLQTPRASYVSSAIPLLYVLQICMQEKHTLNTLASKAQLLAENLVLEVICSMQRRCYARLP